MKLSFYVVCMGVLFKNFELTKVLYCVLCNHILLHTHQILGCFCKTLTKVLYWVLCNHILFHTHQIVEFCLIIFWLLVSVCKFMCGFHLYVVVDGFSVYMLIAIYKIYVNKIFFSCNSITGGGELNRADPGSTASGSVCIRHCPAGSQRCCNLSSVSRC